MRFACWNKDYQGAGGPDLQCHRVVGLRLAESVPRRRTGSAIDEDSVRPEKTLTDKQMLELSRYLRLNPRQLEFNFGLLNRKLVRDLIRTRFGIDYSEQNVGRILKMLGFSPQRPVYQALERDEKTADMDGGNISGH